MTQDLTLFDFEADFAGSLRCVPMAVRLKLDLAGVKLSLRQWSKFTREDRQTLLERPCAKPDDIATYRVALVELVAIRTGELAKSLPLEADPMWENPHRVPAGVADFCRTVGLCPPSLARWAALSELRRFALIKLTRDNHDNINFVPAMYEFGLVEGYGRRGRSAAAERLSA